MDIKIESRNSIIKRSEKPFQKGAVLFSICDTDMQAPQLVHEPDYRFVMTFNDVDGEVFLDTYGNKLSGNARLAAIDKYKPISNEIAAEFAKYYFSIRNGISTVICQCEHGESRSVALAAAIAEYENHDGLKYFIEDEYCPNKLVFRAFYKALIDYKTDKGDKNQ